MPLLVHVSTCLCRIKNSSQVVGCKVTHRTCQTGCFHINPMNILEIAIQEIICSDDFLYELQM